MCRCPVTWVVCIIAGGCDSSVIRTDGVIALPPLAWVDLIRAVRVPSMSLYDISDL